MKYKRFNPNPTPKISVNMNSSLMITREINHCVTKVLSNWRNRSHICHQEELTIEKTTSKYEFGRTSRVISISSQYRTWASEIYYTRSVRENTVLHRVGCVNYGNFNSPGPLNNCFCGIFLKLLNRSAEDQPLARFMIQTWSELSKLLTDYSNYATNHIFIDRLHLIRKIQVSLKWPLRSWHQYWLQTYIKEFRVHFVIVHLRNFAKFENPSILSLHF
jgi:hypothetical protein